MYLVRGVVLLLSIQLGSCTVKSSCRSGDLSCKILGLIMFVRPDPCRQGFGTLNGYHVYAGAGMTTANAICAIPGGALVAGSGPSTTSFGGLSPHEAGGAGSNMYVAILDRYGNARWWTFVGGGAGTVPEAVARDANGNFYVFGRATASFNSQGKSPVRAYGGGAVDAVLAKYNLNGTLQWFTFFGATTVTPGSMRIASNGDIVVSGAANSYTLGGFPPVNPHSGAGQDAWMARVSNDGSLLWYTFLGGGVPTESITDLEEDGTGFTGVGSASANAAAIAGVAAGFSHGGGASDAVLFHVTATGILDRWTYLGGTGVEEGTRISRTAGGFFILGKKSDANAIRGLSSIAGYTGAGSDDLMIARVNDSYVLQWFTTAGSSADDEIATSIVTGLDGAPIAQGTCAAGAVCPSITVQGIASLNATPGGNSAFTIKTTADGNVVWHEFLGNSATGGALAIQEDGQILSYFASGAAITSINNKAPLNSFPGTTSILIQEKPGGGF